MAIKYEKKPEDIAATTGKREQKPQNVAQIEENPTKEMKEALQRNTALMEQMAELMTDTKSVPRQQNRGQRRYTSNKNGPPC